MFYRKAGSKESVAVPESLKGVPGRLVNEAMKTLKLQ